MSSDLAAALVAAAVRAAVLAKAPRRTVAAAAAAVAGAFVRPPAASARRSASTVTPGTQRAAECDAGDDPAVLLQALREARASQRRRKKARRKAAKEVAADMENVVESPQPVGEALGETLQAPAACTAPRPLGEELESLVRDRDEETGVAWIAAACAAADEGDEVCTSFSYRTATTAQQTTGSIRQARARLQELRQARASAAAPLSPAAAQRVRRRRGKTRPDCSK